MGVECDRVAFNSRPFSLLLKRAQSVEDNPTPPTSPSITLHHPPSPSITLHHPPSPCPPPLRSQQSPRGSVSATRTPPNAHLTPPTLQTSVEGPSGPGH